MVTSSRIDSGTSTPNLPFRVRETIKSIKEIVGNHSDADVYAILKESDMEPNKTAEKLLNQVPFREVRRRKEKKREYQNTDYKDSIESRKQIEYAQGTRSHTFVERNAQRGGFVRNAIPDAGISREFRVVRDNRVSQSTKKEKPSPTSANVQVIPNDSGKSAMRKVPGEKHFVPRNSEGQKSSQANGSSHHSHEHVQDVSSNGTHRKGLLVNVQAKVPSSTSQLHGLKSQTSQSQSATSNSSVVGLYASSSDPVHVPSDSRSSGIVGAIKREVGVVGIRKNSVENSAKHSSAISGSFSTSLSIKDISASTIATKSDPVTQTTISGSGVTSTPINRSFSNNHYSGKPHQVLVMGHQKAPQHNMEWKPKSSKKSSSISPGFIETSATPISPLKEQSINSTIEANDLQKFSRVNITENEHVIIPQHLRVPEVDRIQLIFGSFGLEFDHSKGLPSRFHGIGSAEHSNGDPSISVRAPSASSEDVSQVDLLNGQAPSSGSDSPASVVVSDHPLPDNKESVNPGNLQSYVDIGLVRNDSPSYAPAELQKQQDPVGLPSFSTYDPQTGYDMAFFRPVMDEAARGQGLPSPGEVLSSHVANSIPASTVAMVQQPVPQMYPQVHLSPYANFMPYRQYISPAVYVPPMAMPGYSSNPAYPHPSSGSSYVVMQGGGTHLAAGGLKYGTQYKTVPAGTPTGFGTYTNQAGYAINGQGPVGSASGLEESARMKYKDGNLYVPNPQPQVETPEVWIPAAREIPGMQSAQSYYNIAGQAPHAATYMASHTGHTSFNAAATAQPTHLQFPGFANPHHHMGGSNVVGAAPGGAQVGAYQQPQVGHLNWNPNF